MSKAIINLTGSLVIEEIDIFLAAYPVSHRYKVAFSRPELWRKLTALVLSKIPNQYTVLEDRQGRPIYPDFQCASLEKRLKIEQLIQSAIDEILRDYPEFQPQIG